MPYSEVPYGSGKWKYYDPIKILERRGLDRVVREPMAFWMRNSHTTKYDLFIEYPFLERLDYNRLVFETYHGIKARNDELLREAQKREPYLEYCCWPLGCIVNAAMGATLHWKWRAAFEKQLPYWDIRESHVK